MSAGIRRLFFVLFGLGIVLGLAVVVWWASEHPAALIRVVDSAGNPITGAVIQPDGLRTKPGPYASGHYGWAKERHGVPNDPVATDASGFALIPYPQYVHERLETGQISFSVNHPDFVPDRPFRVVSNRPPRGAPWNVWGEYAWNSLRRKGFVTRPEPVVLQKGAILRVSIRPDSPGPKDGQLFVQVRGVASTETNFWTRPEPGVWQTRRLKGGPQLVRAVVVDTNGLAWFSKELAFNAVLGETNALAVALRKGAAVRGELDAAVPRPVTRGRVIARVWPFGHQPQESPPLWHAWTPVRDDGAFELASLPAGDLEIVALCDGFVSTNGPGRFKTRYPQKHPIGTNDLAITIGMEPTARLEVYVTDDQGNPLENARVAAWPNVRYGEWSSTILASDCYNMADRLANPIGARTSPASPPDFEGTTDSSGFAILPNLPATVAEFSVMHPEFVLPAAGPKGDQQRRQATVQLIPGATNRTSVRLEPLKQTPIGHF